MKKIVRSNSSKKRKKKKRHIGRKIFVTLLVILAAAAVVGWLFINGKLDKLKKFANFNFISPENETFEVDPNENNGGNVVDPSDVIIDIDNIKRYSDKNIINILFIGGDSRYLGGGGNSDSMIIVSINRKTNEIKLTSLMRDMYVSIPGYSDNRINAAYAFGGKDLLDQTIEYNFGVKIDGNVAVDFISFVEALKPIGNLDIQLNEEEAYYMTYDPEWSYFNRTYTAGINSLDPDEVLAFARIRNVGNSDFDRTARQRQVITAAFNKVKSMSFGSIINLADQILPCIVTDLSKTEILSLISNVAKNGMNISETFRLPADGTFEGAMVRGMSVILLDMPENSRQLHEFIYGSVDQ